jgi:hypothetical protein
MSRLESLPQEMLSEIFQYYGDQRNIQTIIARVSTRIRQAIEDIFENLNQQDFYCNNEICTCKKDINEIYLGIREEHQNVFPANFFEYDKKHKYTFGIFHPKMYDLYMLEINQIIEQFENIHTINLFTCVTSKQINDLFNVLQRKINITKIFLSFEYLQDNEINMELIANFFKNNSRLYDICFVSLEKIITYDNISIFCEALTHLTSLQKIRIIRSYLNNDMFSMLLNSFQFCRRIGEFEIRDCDFSNNELIRKFCNIITSNPSLGIIRLISNQIRNDAIYPLVDAIRVNRKIQFVDISRNEMDEESQKYVKKIFKYIYYKFQF